MSRLPTPGQDSGSWGAILNDFLSQAHAGDGTIKPGSVTTAALADGAVTTVKLADAAITSVKLGDNSVVTAKIADNAVTTPKILNNAVTTAKIADGAVSTVKIADGSVTAAKLASGAAQANNGIRSLLINYAPPNVFNAKYDNDYAAGILARYDDVVLGTGLEDPGNAYHASTVSIISKLQALSPNTVVWGYIDAGVTNGSANYSLSTLQGQIDQWIAIGATGIFCDIIGYAYGVSRARQNAIIDYVHSKGYGSILNVYNPDEVLGSQVDATYNASGTPTTANSKDVLLLESFVCNSDAYTSPYYATSSDIRTRGDVALAYRTSLGVRLFASNIIGYSTRTEGQIKTYRDTTEAVARIWRLDGTGISGSGYCAAGADVGVAKPRFSAFQSTPFRPSAPHKVDIPGMWTTAEASDLGIIVSYNTGTHDYTWTQL